MRDTVLFVLRNRKLEMLVVEKIYYYVSSILLANIFLTYHHQQKSVQIFAHMKLTNLTLLTSKLY